jgi:hypothetical protein
MNMLEIWPASSPDLNPTEMAWSIIGRKLVTANVKTKVEHVCNEQDLGMGMIDQLVLDFLLDQGMIDRPVLDFWRRCGLRQVCQGEGFRGFSSHIQVSRPSGIGQATAAMFTDYIDDHLLAAVTEAEC